MGVVLSMYTSLLEFTGEVEPANLGAVNHVMEACYQVTQGSAGFVACHSMCASLVPAGAPCFLQRRRWVLEMCANWMDLMAGFWPQARRKLRVQRVWLSRENARATLCSPFC